MELHININKSCNHIVCEENERDAIKSFERNGVDIVAAFITIENTHYSKAFYVLSNGYSVSYQKGQDKNHETFYRIEINDNEDVLLYTNKSKDVSDITSAGWPTMTEAILIKSFEILENL